MTKPTEHAFPGNAAADGREGDFGCTVMDLRKLMELRSADAMNQINVHYGGVMSLCSRLKTNPVEGKGRGRSRGRRTGAGAGGVRRPWLPEKAFREPSPVCLCGGTRGLADAAKAAEGCCAPDVTCGDSGVALPRAFFPPHPASMRRGEAVSPCSADMCVRDAFLSESSPSPLILHRSWTAGGFRRDPFPRGLTG